MKNKIMIAQISNQELNIPFFLIAQRKKVTFEFLGDSPSVDLIPVRKTCMRQL